MPDEADQKQLELLQKGVLFLTERNRELEARVARLEARLDPVPAPPPTPDAAPVALRHEAVFSAPAPDEPVFVAPPISPPPTLPPAMPPPLQTQGLESKVGLTLLNRIGVFTLLIGGALFFKLSVDNEWIGPGARVALGVIAA